MNWKNNALSILALSAFCAASAFGQNNGPSGQQGGGDIHQNTPPPEAFTVCQGKKESDKAELTGPQGRTITGTCVKRGEQLFLRPDHPPKGDKPETGGQQEGQEGQGHRQPPPEAFAACKDKKEGDKAELTGPQGRTITGTCVKLGEQLFLRPDHPPKGEAGGQDRNGSKPTRN